MSFENLCMNCMEDIGDNIQCPHCRFINNTLQKLPYLPYRTIVGGRYLVGNRLASNGEGTTYIAFDIETKAKVTIREFLPTTMATRAPNSTEVAVKPGTESQYSMLLNEFLDLWRKLARMRGLSALVLVIDIIEENNTAYAVCEHAPGTITLRDYLLNGVGYMTWEEARAMFMPVLSTISTLHSAGIIHRGISPDTLFIGPDHKIRIAGFGIPESRNENSSIRPEIFKGYAPVEQFGVQAPSGPWTDIYAFAAVLYRSLIGTVPIESTIRMKGDRMMIPAKFAEQIPAYVINALINALQIMPEDRTKTVEQFRAELTASLTDAMAADFERKEEEVQQRRPEPRPAQPVRQNPQRPVSAQNKPIQANKKSSDPKKTALIAAVSVVAVCLVIFIILCFTVLKDHIGFGGNTGEDTTAPANQAEEMIEVPHFEENTYDSIAAQNYDLEFVVKEEYNDQVKKGYVISQSVAAGNKVPKDSKITLIVSLGVEKITMVDVEGKTYDVAKTTLEELGFKCERLDKLSDGSTQHTSQTVASADLEAGKEYDKGTTVRLQVWVSPEDTTKAE